MSGADKIAKPMSLFQRIGRVFGGKKKDLPKIDYLRPGDDIFDLSAHSAPLRAFDVEQLEIPEPSPLDCNKPTLSLINGDAAKVISLDEAAIDRQDFLDNHKELTVDLLAQSLNLRVLAELADRPRVGLVERDEPTSDLSFLGDFHGNVPRFAYFLRLLLPAIRAGEEELHSLGDLLHAEREENVFNVAASLKLAKAFMMLGWLFPERVSLYTGNHDIFCPTEGHFKAVMDFIEMNCLGTIFDLSNHLLQEGYLTEESEPWEMLATKKNVPQSYLNLHYICLALSEQGVERAKIWNIIQLLQGYYDTCPKALKIKNLFAAHSFPTGATSLEQLRAINDPEMQALRNSLIFSRFAKERDPEDLKSFTPDDIEGFMAATGVEHFVLGHTKPDNSWINQPVPSTSIITSNGIGFGRLRFARGEDGAFALQECPVLRYEMPPDTIISH